MKKYNKLTPEGTRDLLFEESTAINKVSNIIDEVFKSKGYHQVITPALEFYDTFTLSGFGYLSEEIFISTDKKGRLLAMRPDSTVPMARVVSTRLQDEVAPIRLCYNQPIYHNNKSLAGRSNETRQAGMELIGAGGKRADLELVISSIEILEKITPDFRIELGHAVFLKAILNKLTINDDKKEEIRDYIESKNYSALTTLLDEIPQNDTTKALKKLPRLFGGEEVFSKALPLFQGTEAESALFYLKDLYRELSKVLPEDKLMIDLGMVQKNDYYSDMIFCGYVQGSGDAVLTGGRYDHLLNQFDKSSCAAGFGVNVDELARIYMAINGADTPKIADIMVHGDDGFEIDALKVKEELTAQGYTCEYSVFPSEDSAKYYAQKKGIKKLCVVNVNTRIDEI
ncbi:MAG: ATP phosphoribosyltransferase regulatory subunit [Acutalibacteraceae bacterium]|nr:ATP phosphoribosyltransferase regulatory subunit [Acutalibacteraceae bacterium]